MGKFHEIDGPAERSWRNEATVCVSGATCRCPSPRWRIGRSRKEYPRRLLQFVGSIIEQTESLSGRLACEDMLMKRAFP
jgi:hypothetical protein